MRRFVVGHVAHSAVTGRAQESAEAGVDADSLAAEELLERLARTTRELERWGAEREWVGPDPYEGLNAHRFRLLKSRPLGRRFLIQGVKRSPLDLRKLLGVQPRSSAAALGTLLSAYARLNALGEPNARDQIAPIVAKLDELSSAGFEMRCWGYPFDVETRFFFYPAGSPNSIATAFVSLGLLDAHHTTGEVELLARAEEAGQFFLDHVPQTLAPGGAFFGYLPGDRTPIHNANLLVCNLLSRLGLLTGRRDFLEHARAGIGYALEHQYEDGSWRYAETTSGDWIDNFHTGYVLDSLLWCAHCFNEPAIWSAYKRGLDFYADRLFDVGGAPKYSVDHTYPIDGLCVSQAIQTFALAAEVNRAWLGRAWQMYLFASSRMRRADGAFVFQRGRLIVNRTPHVRWVQAPMLAALTELWAAATSKEYGE
jgi:hypothetical protein